MITFEQIYNETNEQVSAHTLRLIKNLHDSEDITMKVFAKISRLNKNPLTCFNPEKSALTTWVHMITNSLILDYFRTNKKHKFISDFVDDDGDKISFDFEASEECNADTDILTSETHQRILKAFRDLKPNYRKIGLMFFIRELTYDEICKNLDMPIGTVKGMLSRCREKLQTELQDLHVVRKTKAIA